MAAVCPFISMRSSGPTAAGFNRQPQDFIVANIKSAKKRAKQTVVRNARNTAQRSQLRTAVKKVLKLSLIHI